MTKRTIAHFTFLTFSAAYLRNIAYGFPGFKRTFFFLLALSLEIADGDIGRVWCAFFRATISPFYVVVGLLVRVHYPPVGRKCLRALQGSCSSEYPASKMGGVLPTLRWQVEFLAQRCFLCIQFLSATLFMF